MERGFCIFTNQVPQAVTDEAPGNHNKKIIRSSSPLPFHRSLKDTIAQGGGIEAPVDLGAASRDGPHRGDHPG
jgi:hypothetical protein